MLDFRNRSTKWPKPQQRNTKRLKKFDGEHLSVSRALRYKYNYSYVRANMRRWLHKNVGRPIDKVYSEFFKTWNESHSEGYSPRDYFYGYLHSKDFKGSHSAAFYTSSIFYVSNGILCETQPKKFKWHIPPHEDNWGRKQIEYNRTHCPELNTQKDGPMFLGKLWARTSGYTRLVNVWMVSDLKFGKEPDYIGKYRKLSNFLKDFTEVTLAGIPSYVSTYKAYDTVIRKKYSFIAKLSDIKQ